MKYLFSVIMIVLGVANLALAMFWFNAIKLEWYMTEPSTYIYNNISIQFTILEIILALIAFGALLVGIFSYQSIRTIAQKTADEYLQGGGRRLIREEVTKLLVSEKASDIDDKLNEANQDEKEGAI